MLNKNSVLSVLLLSILIPGIFYVYIYISDEWTNDMKQLESEFNGRIGVYAINSGTGKVFSYRANERFPLCSSFKGFLAAAVLAKSQDGHLNISEIVSYQRRKLEHHSPITERFKNEGMSVSDMTAAALQYSDNGAANMILEKYIGGPYGMTNFMRSIGDSSFRLDRYELDLNTAIPGDDRDTSTPESVAKSLRKLALGNILNTKEKEIYQQWLIGNTTGAERIRYSIPKEWKVGNKTGTCGVYGTANDFAVIWPSGSSPIVIAVYTTKNQKDAKHDDRVIAEASKIAIRKLWQD